MAYSALQIKAIGEFAEIFDFPFIRCCAKLIFGAAF
jgi:hypothetical protein